MDKTRSDIQVGDLAGIGDETGERRAAIAAAPVAQKGAGRRVPLLAIGAGLVVVAVAVFLVLRLQALDAALAQADARYQAAVATLEDRVAGTSTALRNTDNQTQSSLTQVDGSVRRLGDGLARASAQLEQQGREAARQAAELKAAAAELKRLAGVDGQHDTRAKALADSLEAIAARQKTQADTLARLEKSGDIVQLRSELSVLDGSLRELQAEHERRLRTLEQVQASNDAFRRQVNATLDRQSQQVAELYQRIK